MVRLRVAKMGQPAYGSSEGAALRSPGTGRCNRGAPWRVACDAAIREGSPRRPPERRAFLSCCAGLHSVAMVQKVLLASPRGYCAGVERAVETVERALELRGTPIYVRKQIVHNLHVVRALEDRGAVFVEDENEVPVGGTIVVFSAPGVAPSVLVERRARGSCKRTTRPARSSRRCTSRRAATRPTATPSS